MIFNTWIISNDRNTNFLSLLAHAWRKLVHRHSTRKNSILSCKFIMVNGIAVLLKYKIKNNKICCSYIKIRQLTKIIWNFVIHFIYLFKNNGTIIFIVIICSNCIITPKWDVIMNPFFSLSSSIAITILYLQGHINTYVRIILQKMKSLCFTTEQGNYTFLEANWNKLRSN